jgi:hypothetical protein
VIRFVVYQYRYACRVGFGRRQAAARALRTYFSGF